MSIIVAMDEDGGIGIDKELPWHLSDDLRRFKQLTMGHHILMGRKTFESIGRPLPGRHTTIVTRNPSYRAEGCRVAHSLEAALRMARQEGEDEAFICGGTSLFNDALESADRIYLTRVHTQTQADTFFPPFDPKNWKEKLTFFHEADEVNEYPFTFQVLER